MAESINYKSAEFVFSLDENGALTPRLLNGASHKKASELAEYLRSNDWGRVEVTWAVGDAPSMGIGDEGYCVALWQVKTDRFPCRFYVPA